MANKLRFTWSRFCGWLLSALGFAGVASCRLLPAPEYGCPTMDYRVIGKVTDADGKPIPGIAVSHYDFPDEEGYSWTKKVHTDADGAFELVDSEFPQDTLHIHFVDVDGAANGEYESKEVPVTLTQTKKGDGRWYDGTFEARDVEVVLEEKKKAE